MEASIKAVYNWPSMRNDDIQHSANIARELTIKYGLLPKREIIMTMLDPVTGWFKCLWHNIPIAFW